MKTALLHILTFIHFISIGGLALYGLHRIWFLVCWWREQNKDEEGAGAARPTPIAMKTSCCNILPDSSAHILPFPDCDQPHSDGDQAIHGVNLMFSDANPPLITVQVPLYNEPLVAARIIDAVSVFDWPKKRLEIQILDDSSDGTSKIVKERIAYWAERGVRIYGIFRKDRTGYKAGALQNGLKQSMGEFVAIFDADFIPAPDFLKKTVPHFYMKSIEHDSVQKKSIGMIQTRWSFLNSRYSWLTRLQSLLLSPHFGIEHKIRASRHLFFNFNGTAGIWRKEAIESAGGWQDDTVTEDLDLSYRAQLAGWRFLYLNDILVPSELPVSLSDFRCQQERWSKGSIQTAIKILPLLMSAPIPLSVKIESVAHLMANFCWLLGFIVTITLYPVLLYRIDIGIYDLLWIDLPLFCISSGAILAYYFVYNIFTRATHNLLALPILPVISIGLAPCFALSVLKGVFQKGGVFTRTPKFGISDDRYKHSAAPVEIIASTSSYANKSVSHQIQRSGPGIVSSKNQSQRLLNNLFSVFHNQTGKNLLLNIPLLIYSLVPVLFTWQQETWSAIPFLCLFPLGFLLVVGNDIHSVIYQSIFCKTIIWLRHHQIRRRKKI